LLEGRPFLTAEWRDLVIFSYEVQPVALAPFVPPGTELDTWRGRTFLSLVGFRFLHTRILGLPVPFHRSFEEVNLRFYVRREAQGQLRRGVVFIRELVPRRAVALVARVLYNEPYAALPMRSHPPSPGEQLLEYAWRLGDRWHRYGGRPGARPSIPLPGSLGEFITEHYWGYTRRRDGGTLEYRVTHPRWVVSEAAEAFVDADFGALYGPTLAAQLATPQSTVIAGGSAVTVYRPTRLP
jgi:uncharacterized protein YqjF (DUF2071 family)